MSVPGEILDTVISKLQNLVNSKTVVGEPVEAAGKTLIPVIKVSIGFGAGGGEQGGDKKQGTGGGGGAGAQITPVAFIVIDEDGVRLLLVKPGKVDNILESLPDFIEKVGSFVKKKDKWSKAAGENGGNRDEDTGSRD